MDTKDIDNILSQVAQNEGILNYEFNFGEKNEAFAGFIGDFVFVKINDKDSEKELDLAIKLSHREESQRERVPTRTTFENEAHLYTKFWPELSKFQKSHRITKPFDSIGNCYTWSLEENHEYIVMQNLKNQGYGLFPKTYSFTYEDSKLIFQTYARYHAISFAMRQQCPEKLQEIFDSTHNVYEEIYSTENFASALTTVVKNNLKILETANDEEITKQFSPYAENSMDLFRSVLNYKGKYPVLTHGDCWSNNLMIKRNENGLLTDIKLIDWQLVRPASVVHDLSYCFYSAASKDALDRLDDLLKIYHECLTQNLREMGEDSEKLFSFEALKNEWKEYCKFGFIFSLLILRMKFAKPNEIQSQEKNVSFATCDVDSQYEGKVIDLIRHFFEIKAL